MEIFLKKCPVCETGTIEINVHEVGHDSLDIKVKKCCSCNHIPKGRRAIMPFLFTSTYNIAHHIYESYYRKKEKA